MQALAYHIGRKISIQEILKSSKRKIQKRDRYFVLFEEGPDQSIYIKDYGSVVFVGIEEDKAINILRDEFSIGSEEILKTEELEVEESLEKGYNVHFDGVVVPDLTIEIIHLICLNLAQSVLLSSYQEKADEVVSESAIISVELRDKGKVSVSRKKLRRLLGTALVLKTSVAENLYIFETPEFASSDEELTELDTDLSESLDIINRHKSLQHSLNTVTDGLTYLIDILQHKHSTILEWIIILLIAFEIIQVLMEKVF